jgi:histidinol-phosphate aminotransferase
MLAAITPQTRMIFIANPNNPTGTLLSGDSLANFLAEVPDDVVVVLDEAYTEYLSADVRYDSIAWLARFPNLVITRTFSKVYGLAGLRVGFALASPPVADLVNRVRQPFNVSSVALAAAEAALDDDEFIARSVETNTQGMRQITEGLLDLGLEFIPSCGNFVTFRAGDAAAVNARLLRDGVIVRPIAGYGLPEHLRVTIGLPEENARFLSALERALV